MVVYRAAPGLEDHIFKWRALCKSYRDNRKENGNHRDWGYSRIMEKEMETSVMGYIGIQGLLILCSFWGAKWGSGPTGFGQEGPCRVPVFNLSVGVQVLEAFEAQRVFWLQSAVTSRRLLIFAYFRLYQLPALVKEAPTKLNPKRIMIASCWPREDTIQMFGLQRCRDKGSELDVFAIVYQKYMSSARISR